MTVLFQYILVKSSFYCFFIRTLLVGEGGVLQKDYVLYARENDEKNGRTLNNICFKANLPSNIITRSNKFV